MPNTEELIMTCLAYETLFDDFSSVNIASIAQDIPYLAALNFIVAKHKNFYYCLSDLERQRNELFELRLYFRNEKKVLSRLDSFIFGPDNPYLIDNTSTIYFEMYILQYSDKQNKYLQPIITQYFIDNKSEIWLLFLIAHSKR